MSYHLNLGPPSIGRAWCDRCREETVHKYAQCIHHDGIVHPSVNAFQPNRPAFRLTAEIRREIRHRVRDHILTIPQAAREYGVVDQTIRNIVRGGVG